MTDAQIYSQGYRRYEGPRTGVAGAMRSLIKHSIRKSLGLGRSARHKIIPLLVIIIAYLPAIGMITVSALFKEYADLTSLLPGYGDYYGFITVSIMFMAAFMTPDLLCTDRRTGFLGVYLASPLNRITYLAGKAIASLLMIFTVTLGPPLFLLITYSLQKVGPDGFADWMETLLKIIMSAGVIGIFYVALSLAVSSITDRKSFATTAFFAIVFGSIAFVEVLIGQADASKSLRLLDALNLPMEIVLRLFGDEDLYIWSPKENPTDSLWIAWFAWVLIALTTVWISYRRMLVRR